MTRVATRLPRPRAASAIASSKSSYGISVDTGPNASTSWTASFFVPSRHSTSVGAKKAPLATPSPFGAKPSPAPKTISLPWASSASRSPTSACCAFEASAPIFTPSTAGSPTLTLARRSRSRAAIASRCRRGTIARRIAVHFWPALTVISRATSLANRSNSSSSGLDVGAEDGGVERVGLGVERDRARQQVGVAAQLQRRVGRAGEGDDVAALEPVEQVAGRADDELQAPRGQQARAHHHPHQRLGEVARRRRRLGDAGHAGEEGRRELLEQAPDREVEGVDVDGDAAARHQDVGRRELPLLAEHDRRPFVQDVARRQLVAAHRRVGVERAGAALDVDPAVAARRAGVARDRVELFLPLVEVGRERLQARRALLEVEREQRRAAGAARERERLAEVELVGMGVVDRRAVDGAGQRRAFAAADPAVGDQALQDGHGRPQGW